MGDIEGRARDGREGLAVMLRAIIGVVEQPDHPPLTELNTWPDRFADSNEVRQAMLQLLVQDYAEFLLDAVGAEQAVPFFKGKLARLEAIGMERDIYGHDAVADGWLDG